MANGSRKISNEDREKARVLTPMFRASYPHLFKPNAMPGTNQDPKYSITMLFDKEQDLSVLKQAIKQAKLNYFGSKANWPEKIGSPVTDGDLPKFEDKEGYAGHWIVKASSNQDQKPGLVDKSGKVPIEDAADFYPGCYARAYVYAYVWEFPKNSGRFGVGFILDHVQKLKDGEPFGGRKRASDVFSPMEGDDEDDGADDSDDDQDF